MQQMGFWRFIKLFLTNKGTITGSNITLSKGKNMSRNEGTITGSNITITGSIIITITGSNIIKGQLLEVI